MNYLTQSLALPCGAHLSNRLAKASMTEGLGDSSNRATDRHHRLYKRWSEGGAGLLLTGNVLVDRAHLERAGNIAVDNNGGIDELRSLAEAGRCAGNHLWMQINHPGKQTPEYLNAEPLAPSALAPNIPGFGHSRAMSETQIADVIRRFVHVARVAQNTGFTGVQVHAAHGYLLSQFLSPLTNQRKDSWGGSLENRARLLMEIVKRTRQAVGADYPVAVKLNSADFQKGGFTDDESIQVVEWLSQLSIDLVEISGGNYEAQQMLGPKDAEPKQTAGAPKKESTRLREAYFLDYARRVRPVAKVPLMITGGFRSKTVMEQALERNELDVVGMARPMCNGPDICRGLLDGSLDTAGSPEEDMRIDRATVDSDMSDEALRAMETAARVAWSSMQISRLGDGKEPDESLALLDASNAQQLDEEQRAAALEKG